MAAPGCGHFFDKLIRSFEHNYKFYLVHDKNY